MESVALGIYEKALDTRQSWNGIFEQVRSLGFDFVDLSIDESEARIDRLYRGIQETELIRDAAERFNVQIGGICLSAHRRFALGSPVPENEIKGCDILLRSIDFARAIGASVVQIAGYYSFYDKHDEQCEQRFINNLAKGVRYAAKRGVLLGIENVDGQDLIDLTEVRRIINLVNSPWLQVYPDIGNCAYNNRDVRSDLAAVEGHIVAIHIKDVLPGRARRVPFGQGVSDFDGAFSELHRQRWSGRIMIEMWNDNRNVESQCLAAKAYTETKLRNL